MLNNKYLIFFLFALFFPFKLHASSCCGGGSSSSLILLDDDLSSISLGMNFRNDLGQTDGEGWASFNEEGIVDKQSSLNIQWQRLLNESIQIAFKSGLSEKTIFKQKRYEKKSGLSETELQTTYEFLPEYNYSLYKPRGFVFLKASIPGSPSLYDSKSNIFSDVRGTGLYSLSSGAFFIKRFSTISLKSAIEWQHIFGRTFQTKAFKLHDYNKFNFPMSMGFSLDPMPFTIGAGLTWNYQSAKKFTGSINNQSQSEYFWETSAFINWVISREKSLGLSYSDSTLVGKNISSPLYRTIGFTFTQTTAL